MQRGQVPVRHPAQRGHAGSKKNSLQGDSVPSKSLLADGQRKRQRQRHKKYEQISPRERPTEEFITGLSYKEELAVLEIMLQRLMRRKTRQAPIPS